MDALCSSRWRRSFLFCNYVQKDMVEIEWNVNDLCWVFGVAFLYVSYCVGECAASRIDDERPAVACALIRRIVQTDRYNIYIISAIFKLTSLHSVFTHNAVLKLRRCRSNSGEIFKCKLSEARQASRIGLLLFCTCRAHTCTPHPEQETDSLPLATFTNSNASSQFSTCNILKADTKLLLADHPRNGVLSVCLSDDNFRKL